MVEKRIWKKFKQQTVENVDKYMNNNEVLARNYSEGSVELYNCLLELWKNDFETIGCCIGHNGNTQYIGLNRNNNDKLIKFLSLINKDDIVISFLNNHVSIKKNKNKDIYNSVLNSIKKLNENDIAYKDKEIEDVINFIDNNYIDKIDNMFGVAFY